MKRMLWVLVLAAMMATMMVTTSGLSARAQRAQGQVECVPWTWDYFYSTNAQRWYYEWWRWCWSPAQGWFQDWDGWDWA